MNTNPQGARVADRVYVPADDVARACGLSLLKLLDVTPGDWASPRDFLLPRRGVMLFAEASLYRLADALLARGASDAALLLRDYIKQVQSSEVHGSAVANELMPIQRELVERSEDELQRELAPRAHPSDRESGRFAWENE